MGNGARVTFDSETGKGKVWLGWGRGHVLFEIDEQTGEPTNWENPNANARKNVSDLLIQRAKKILVTNCDCGTNPDLKETDNE